MPSRSKLLRVLRPYQDEAIDYILEKKFAALFIDMGMGKTTVFLHAILELPKPILLVGPIKVIESVWMQEASEWMATRNISFSILRGSPDQRAKAAEKPADVYLVNPELLEEALEEFDIPFRVLAIDESTLFKNPSSKRFKTLRKHLKQFTHRYIMTGTPAPNSLMDLWSQIFILDRGERLDTSFNRFRNKFFYTTDWQGYKFEPHDWAKDEILEEISDLVYRARRDRLYDELPPIHNVITLPLPPKARKVYDEMEKLAFSELSDGTALTARMAVTKTMKLRQIASGFVYDEEGEVHKIHSAKIEKLREILETAPGPVIVVYQFVHELKELMRVFPQGVKYAPSIQRKWDKGKIPLMFLHPQSGGHGLNLQFGGSVMVIFSGSYSLEQMDQVRGRIDRSGQKNLCIYHYLVAENTVDLVIMDVLESRAENQSEVLKLLKGYADAKKINHSRRTRRKR